MNMFVDTSAERTAMMQSFSNVSEPFSDEVAQTIAICGMQVVWSMYQERFGSHLQADAAALARHVDSWITHDLQFDDAWCVAAGRMKTSLRGTCLTQARAALIDLALHLVSGGRALHWTGSILGLTGLSCGTCALPEGDILVIAADEVTARVFVDGNLVFDSLRDADATSFPFDVFDAVAAAATFKDVGPDVSGGAVADVRASLTQSFALLAELPDFDRWVRRLTRKFVPLRIRDDTHLSRSFIHRPGLVCASCPSSPTMLAELLVHEATHQYFYLLGGFAPFEDGSDTTGYFSPVKGCKRPIFNILLAYHAFGNILMFHRTLLDQGLAEERAFSLDRAAQIENYLPVFEASLAASPGLSASGHALWQPIAQRCAVVGKADAVA